MSEQRYDISYATGAGLTPLAYIDTHFCREWDDRGGCYGNNPQHGLSWEMAREAMVDFHEQEVARWRGMKEADL